MHLPGKGSDADDALNLAVNELLHGRYPFYARTYLDNPVANLPGTIFLAVPFALLGNSAYQNFFWLMVFFIAVSLSVRSWRLGLMTGVVGALVGRWDALPLAGMILTCIDRDGTMSGPDVETLARVRRMTGLELQYSGGISSVEDISRVAGAGAQAVVLGKALYEGRITLEQALAG